MQIDPASQIDPLSRTVVHLTMLFNETKLATGTGVLSRLSILGIEESAQFNNRLFLITALHNLTGREPTGQVKHSEGGLPNYVLIEGFYVKERAPLYAEDNDPNTAIPLFWIHGSGPAIDVCLLPLAGNFHHAGTLHHGFLDPIENEYSMPLKVSQTCYIIGFPEGLVDRPQENLVLPIWKTGNIASEPAFDFQGEPVVIIDATTRPGMSGAPVIVRNDRIYEPRRRLVGIYTGRTSDSSNLGKVFKPHTVNEVRRRGPLKTAKLWN